MVKFSKQLESQLVPEWKSAFCNYWQLKKDLKQIKLSQPARHSFVSPRPSISALGFSNLTRRRSVRKDVILVHLRHSGSNTHEDYYETEFVDSAADRDVEKAFFATLDIQLNKVNEFYKTKESLLLQRGEDIKLQLQKLITMRKFCRLLQGYGGDMSEYITQGDLNNSQQTEDNCQQSSILASTEEILELENASRVETEPNGYSRAVDEVTSNAISPIELNIPKTNPSLPLAAVVQMLWDDLFSQMKNGVTSWRHFSRLDKKKMQYADKMLRVAFVELYRGLGLLRSFSYLNMVAFTKILKKYDKITGRDASSTYLKVVERSYFHNSDKVLKMMDEIEKIFTNYFAKGDHKKAMTFLRPIQQKSSHTVTFFLGLFIGFSIACLLTFGVLLHINGFHSAADSDSQENRRTVYMNTVFPVFSFLSLVVLHLYMYGWNLFMWRKKRINYPFIFEFATNTELKYRDVLLISSSLATLVVGGLLVHLIAYTNFSTAFNTSIIPLLLLAALLCILFLPFDFCHRSSRYFLLASFQRIILSPLYKVVMADFFLADQLTSQVYTFRNAEYLICYYITSHLSRSNNVCTSDNINFQAFAYLISLLPYWWRMMQCFRRWIDEHDQMHVANGGKYLSAMVAAVMVLTYRSKMTKSWMAMSIICSTLATSYQLYWDFVVDWGLLRTKSKNYLLRDQLVLEQKSVYFLSMVLNFFLRLAWLQSITRVEVSEIDHKIFDFLFASLEVIRRGHWNFYRLENEHLNNVGKFRATKTVPLPFRIIENET